MHCYRLSESDCSPAVRVSGCFVSRDSRSHLVKSWLGQINQVVLYLGNQLFFSLLSPYSSANSFRWAWQNPHITQHIPAESRIQHATQKKRSGQPKRPRHSVASLLSNLHLLLRAPSFSRWPLELRFFSEDVYKAWVKWSQSVVEPIRDSLDIVHQFPLPAATSSGKESSPKIKRKKLDHGITALAVDYSDHKQHVEKGKDIIDFEREGSCTICHDDLDHDGGIYTICPNPGCESVTHLTCLSKHFLKGEEGAVVPIDGNCPSSC